VIAVFPYALFHFSLKAKIYLYFYAITILLHMLQRREVLLNNKLEKNRINKKLIWRIFIMAYSLNTSYHFVSHSGNGACMNVYGNDTVSHNRKVCLWAYYDTKSQNFQIQADGNYLKIVSTINTNYALNAWRKTDPYGCDVYPYAGNEKDARIQLEAVDTANNLYKIKLLNYSKYLTAPAVIGNNGVINWSAKFTDSSAAQRQIWKLTTSSINLAKPAVHNQGHIVSYDGKGGCLNVYGNEVISPNRKVCIWKWDDKNAQNWVVGSVNGKTKVFSTLNYPQYALNIYRNGTNACDVYPHTGNDNDSEIFCEPIIPGNPFRCHIRLKLSGLYLTATGPGNGANVVWSAFRNNDSQIWKITNTKPESTSVPGKPMEGADSPLVTTVIPSGDNRYASRGGTKISEITIHHFGYINGSVEGQGAAWSNNNGTTSSHYSIKDDTIGQFVSEENTAYTNGDKSLQTAGASNMRAVTIEVVNSNTADDPSWPVSEKSFQNLIKLVADIAKRNGLEKLTLGISDVNGKWTKFDKPEGNLTWHSMYSYTTCPGNFLRSRLQLLCDKANAINGYK